MKKLLFTGSVVLSLTGCAYSIHEVHMGDFDPKHDVRTASPVEADAEQFVILGFVGNTDYVDKVRKELESKCRGPITGIATRYSTALGFLSWTNKIRMSGYCHKDVI